jgi:hypothetical protein
VSDGSTTSIFFRVVDIEETPQRIRSSWALHVQMSAGLFMMFPLDHQDGTKHNQHCLTIAFEGLECARLLTTTTISQRRLTKLFHARVLIVCDGATAHYSRRNSSQRDLRETAGVSHSLSRLSLVDQHHSIALRHPSRSRRGVAWRPRRLFASLVACPLTADVFRPPAVALRTAHSAWNANIPGCRAAIR